MQVVAKDVTFTYPGSKAPVVTDWSETFEPGMITAITGKSGAGKSTRLYLLALLVRIGAGELLLDGERVDNLSDAARARIRADHFGFIFQDAALDDTRTVLDNITEVALYQGKDPRALKDAALSLMEQLGVDVPADRKPGQISGGQAQRIAVCRALVANPDVVFADEPTGNLDPETTVVVLDALRAHARAGATVIVVTHDQQVTDFADRHIQLGV